MRESIHALAVWDLHLVLTSDVLSMQPVARHCRSLHNTLPTLFNTSQHYINNNFAIFILRFYFQKVIFLGYFLTTMWVTMMRLCFLIQFNKLILIKKFDSLLNYLIQTCSIKLLEITHQHGPMIPRDSSQVIMTPEIIRWIWTRLNSNI